MYPTTDDFLNLFGENNHSDSDLTAFGIFFLNYPFEEKGDFNEWFENTYLPFYEKIVGHYKVFPDDKFYPKNIREKFWHSVNVASYCRLDGQTSSYDNCHTYHKTLMINTFKEAKQNQ